MMIMFLVLLMMSSSKAFSPTTMGIGSRMPNPALQASVETTDKSFDNVLKTTIEVGTKMTSSDAYERLLAIVALGVISSVDGAYSGDWSKYGLVTLAQENQLQNVVNSLGIFHIACASLSSLRAWQREQPVAPAAMKTLLIGGLALIQVFFQNEPRLVRFPWASGDTGISDSPLSTWANSDTLAKLKLGIATRSAGKYDQLAVSSELDSLIGLKPLVIFSWRNCPYCQKAIQLIGETDAREFEIIQLDEGFYRGKPGKALRAELGKRTGRTSVPSIWIGGKFVGGCNDGPDGGLVALWGDGREGNALVEMLRKSGAIPARISAVSELELGPWLKEKIGDNGMMFLGLLSVTPYALFFLKALGN